MAEVVRARPIALSEIDLRWLAGTTIDALCFHEPDLWVLSFSGGGHLTTQSRWRILSAESLVVASGDHGRSFGLPEPLDVGELAASATSGSMVSAARIAAAAPDLELLLDNGLRLQVLADSRGYECWQVTDPSGVAVAVSGSGVASTWFDQARGQS